MDVLVVGGMVGEAGRADEVVADPARRPERPGADGVAGVVDVAVEAEVPELAPAVLIGLAAVEQEFAERLDLVGQFVGPLGIAGDERRLGNDRLFFDEGVVVILHRSEEHTSELQSLMRISYAVFCLKKKNTATISLYS